MLIASRFSYRTCFSDSPIYYMLLNNSQSNFVCMKYPTNTSTVKLKKYAYVN